VQVLPLGQVCATPLQATAPHDGRPGAPAGAAPHVPFAVAPSDCAHTAHAPEQGWSQQYPSAH
jgi:hypothetical protein